MANIILDIRKHIEFDVQVDTMSTRAPGSGSLPSTTCLHNPSTSQTNYLIPDSSFTEEQVGRFVGALIDQETSKN